MRFAVLPLITLASAAAVRRADYGSWNVTLDISSAANGFQSRDLTATYSSTNLAEPVTVTCEYKNVPYDTTENVDSCTDSSFSYTYFSSTVGITQNVLNVTLTGEKELTQTCSTSGRSCTITGTIPASAAA